MNFSAPFDGRKIVKKIKRKFLWCIPYETTVADWLVLTPYRFYFSDKCPKQFVLVQSGWETDLASVPGFFGFVVQKDGDFAQAAVTHDWCYKNRGNVVYEEKAEGLVRCQPLSREEQDRVFLNGMKLLGTSLPIRVIMWRAVRRFGWISYPKKP